MINQVKVNQLLAAMADFATRIGTANGVLIQNMTISELDRSLYVTYSNGQTVNLGVVKGEDGDSGTNGVGILNVELFEDPLENNQVYLQTTLSNGIILRTQNSLNGYHGRSIRDAYLENNQFIFVLDDDAGTTLTPIAVEGLQAVSVVGVEARPTANGTELFWLLSNGQELASGIAEDLRGRSLLSLVKVAHQLVARFSDDPDTDVIVGQVNGLEGLGIVDGSLVGYYEDDPETPITIGTLSMVIGARVEAGELIFITNQPEPANEINVGPVANLRGADGASVVSVRLENNEFIFTVSGGVDLPPVPVSGLTPISIVGARFDQQADELFLLLSNGSELPAGITSAIRGRGVVNATIDNAGKLYFHYSDDPTTPVEVGMVPAIIGTDLVAGKLRVYYNTAPTVPVEIGTLLGFKGMRLEANGALVAIFTDDSESPVGIIRSVGNFQVSAGKLIVTYNDGTQADLGQVIGPRGEDGIGFLFASINQDGDLIIQRSDGETVNAGFTRQTIQNFIGQVIRTVASAGQTLFNIPHNGEVLFFADEQLIAEEYLDLNITSSITYSGPALAADTKIRVVVYAPGGVEINSRGIQSVGLAPDSETAYEVLLQDGTSFTIETMTPIPVEALPIGIKSLAVLPNGHLQVTWSDDTIEDVGSTNNAINTTSVLVNESGRLIVTLSDGQVIDAGSVLSNLTVVSANIVAGRLIIEFSAGGTFDAGNVGMWITGATIDANDQLIITLSDNSTINAGIARNPLLGAIHDFVAVQGQYEFPVLHAGFAVSITINGSTLNKSEIDLTAPYVRVVAPRNSGDEVRILTFSNGSTQATSIVGVNDAANETYYGKDKEGVVGFHPLALTKIARPFHFTATAGQTAFPVPHNGDGSVAVYVNGYRKHAGLSYPTGLVQITPAMVGGEEVIIELLREGRGPGDLLVGSYARVTYDTYSWGGSFSAKAWRVRALNKIVSDSLGIHLENSRILLPAGTYYVRGYAAAYGVRQNALRLYSQTTGQQLLLSGGHFAGAAGPIPSNSIPDSQTPIEGYFTIPVQSQVVLQHRCVSSYSGCGFGRGNGLGYAPGSLTPADVLGVPGRLVDLQLWKVG